MKKSHEYIFKYEWNPFSTFFKKHSTKENIGITHTRIGSKELNIYGGKYIIPDEKTNEFYKLYHRKVFINKKMEF